MRRAYALLAMALCSSIGCRVFEPGLPEVYDGGVVRRPTPTDARPRPADAPRSEDLAADRRRDEPAIPGPPADLGCADGTREAFTSAPDWPNIAGCSGAWSVPGLLGPEARAPVCDRAAGNDGMNVWGQGCSVSDLCALGWHVCRDASDVRRSSPAGCESAVDSDERRFFLVLAGASPQGICSPDRGAQNDLHGCGTLGQSESAGCDPLNRRMSFYECQSSGVWSCGDASDHLAEATLVSKSDPALGGALCCRDN
jgi:hypothetical protein